MPHPTVTAMQKLIKVQVMSPAVQPLGNKTNKIEAATIKP